LREKRHELSLLLTKAPYKQILFPDKKGAPLATGSCRLPPFCLDSGNEPKQAVQCPACIVLEFSQKARVSGHIQLPLIVGLWYRLHSARALDFVLDKTELLMIAQADTVTNLNSFLSAGGSTAEKPSGHGSRFRRSIPITATMATSRKPRDSAGTSTSNRKQGYRDWQRSYYAGNKRALFNPLHSCRL
jgi:hypothetical protein